MQDINRIILFEQKKILQKNFFFQEKKVLINLRCQSVRKPNNKKLNALAKIPYPCP